MQFPEVGGEDGEAATSKWDEGCEAGKWEGGGSGSGFEGLETEDEGRVEVGPIVVGIEG